ncbi:hypothetical protein B484DRAFT_479142 [Ochromonadaceae sp. CCMP2298]|nr:hypothetical protein B484DRAFT_479142 [Ochromonadaceae sp. CCMP2298]
MATARLDGGEFHSPFKLQIIVHGAESLPIADYTASDPYVKILIGGRLEGRTKTVFRDLNPSWNELFNVKLLHRRAVITLQVYDADVGKDDDLLGVVSINLRGISLDESVQMKYPITGMGGYGTASSKLEVSILIRKNESAIRVVPDEIKSSEVVKQQILSSIATIIQEFPTIHVPESVFNAFTRYITEDTVDLFTDSLLKDFLLDIMSFSIKGAEMEKLAKEMRKDVFNRNMLRVVNGSKIVLRDRSIYWHPPIEKDTLLINTSPNDSSWVSLELYNRFSIWVLVRWTCLLYDYWSCKAGTAIPFWAADSPSYTFFGRASTSDGRSYSGRMVLSLDRAFSLRAGEVDISLKNMCSVTMSADSMEPHAYILNVDVLSFSASGVFSKADKEILESEQEQTRTSEKGLFRNVRKNIRGTLKGVAFGAAHVASDVAARGQHVAEGVATTTIGAARTIATGNAVEIIKGAQNNFLGIGKDFRSVINEANTLFGEEANEDFLAAKFDHVSQKLAVNRSDRNSHFYVDLNQDALSRKSMGSFARGSASSVTHDTVASIFPSFDVGSPTFSLMSCRGHDNTHVLSGFKRLSMAQVNDKLDTVMEIPLDMNLGFSVTLVRSTGLQLNIGSNGLLNTLSGAGLHAKMKFTDKNGSSGLLGRGQEFRTPSTNPNANPDWGEFSALFNSLDSFANAHYIRIEICLDDFTTNVVIGTCFIPLVVFRSKTKEITLPMTRFKQTITHPCDPKVLHSLGTTTVRIKRIEESADVPCVAVIRASLLECNIFNTRWFCECIPAGAVNAESVTAECFSLMAIQDGLELVIGGKEDKEEKKASSEPLSPLSPLGDSVALEDLNLAEDWGAAPAVVVDETEVVVECYENQRRQPYYPFDWSNKAYTRPLFSDFTYAVAFTFDTLYAAFPPEHCRWKSEWEVDKAHTATDIDGWSYGFTFGKILAYHAAGKSVTKPVNMHARRRKWVRRAEYKDRAKIGRGQNFQMVNTGKGGPCSPKSGAGRSSNSGRRSSIEVADAVWRDVILKADPKATMATCRERLSSKHDVLIDWDHVMDATVVTPSVLSVSVTISRYFDTGAYAGTFRPTNMEVFVSNCPAAQLKCIISERKSFHTYKQKIKRLIKCGNCFGLDDVEYQQLMDRQADEDGVPETEELSLGSELVADLDSNSIGLEATLKDIDKIIGGSTKDSKQASKEKEVLVRRDLRLRLYMAALFGSKLKGGHHFVEEDIRKIMKRDFEVSKSIVLDTEIATASNRIEFYLDTAEKRIRDAVLCGWGYRHGQLERCLEILANGYFIEIVGLLGMFFEGPNGMGDSSSDASNVKGLGNKVDLIMTYLQHNDRLATILDHALRPYAMRAKPAATLSLFLDFDILASWYTSVLLLEMRGRVDDVLAVWQDVTKDVTGHSGDYKFGVPWIPQHTEVGEDLYFYTCIPEDLVEILLTYLQYARIKKSSVAESFQQSVGRLDTEVLMAYTSSFLFLAEQVQAALASKLWSSASEEDELEEYSTWLAGVANDARRVETNQLYASKCVQDAMQQGEEMKLADAQGLQHEEILNQRARQAFNEVMLCALDHLSCIVFVYAFHVTPELLTKHLFYSWHEHMESDEPDSPNQVVVKAMEDVCLFIRQMMNFVSYYCYCSLVTIAADKMVVLYLTLLKMAQHKGCVFGDQELAQYRCDKASMKASLSAALAEVGVSSADYEYFQAIVSEKFRALDLCEGLFAHPLASVGFDLAMEQLLQLAKEQPEDAEALSRLIQVCFGLKGVKKYASKKHMVVSRRSLAPTPAHEGNAQSSASKPRRTSVFDMFRGPTPIAAPIAVPTAPQLEAKVADAFEDEEDDEGEEEDDEEEQFRQEMERVKQKVLEDCVSVMLDSVCAVQKKGRTHHRVLRKNSPLVRVFGHAEVSQHSLAVQLQFSGNPAAAPDSTASAGFVSGIGSAFKSLFRPTHHSLSPQTSPRLNQTLSASDDCTDYMFVSGLQVRDLFYLADFRKPHPFLTIEYGSFKASTKVVESSNSADWSADDPIRIPLTKQLGSPDPSIVKSLVITLHYQGYFSASVIGSVSILCPEYAPPVLDDARYTIQDYSKSPQATQAAKAVRELGKDLPVIRITLERSSD